jgi:para-aminobenzoate synthetase
MRGRLARRDPNSGRRGGSPARPPPLPPASAAPDSLLFALRDPAEAYLANIAACRREIIDGESYVVCLTTGSFGARGTLDPGSAYRALRARNPAPFAALLRLGELSVLSSSPDGSCAWTANAPSSLVR